MEHQALDDHGDGNAPVHRSTDVDVVSGLAADLVDADDRIVRRKERGEAVPEHAADVLFQDDDDGQAALHQRAHPFSQSGCEIADLLEPRMVQPGEGDGNRLIEPFLTMGEPGAPSRTDAAMSAAGASGSKFGRLDHGHVLEGRRPSACRKMVEPLSSSTSMPAPMTVA